MNSMKPRRLIQEGLQRMVGNNSWFDSWVKPKNVRVEIRALEYEFFRAEVFLEDVLEISGEPSNTFNLGDLMAILYDDFLQDVRRGVNPAEKLHALKFKLQTLREADKTDELRRVSKDHWERQRVASPRGRQFLVMEMEMSRQAALRGEVFLMDLEKLDPHFRMTLNGLLSLLFRDFVREVQGSRQRELVKELLKRIDNEA